MKYQVESNADTIKGVISLPSSKSISNRVLIINALSYSPYPIINLSNSDDTVILQQSLFSNHNKFDVGHAGTAMRFLTAFLSMIVGEWEITGSDRMKQRPIGILVDALNHLGANIQYLGNNGFPPLKIYGSHLKGKSIKINGSVSSQYISALLLIAPSIENGLTLELTGAITSRSYIYLTLNLMSQFGIRHKWENNKIIIPEQNYLPNEYFVESDWSAASYWYQILAIAQKGEIFLKNLKLNSLQGDSKIAIWFKSFGISSQQKENGVLIKKNNNSLPDILQLNLIENPDIAQTMACLCIAKKLPFHFSGLKTLKIKETNRIIALQNELKKFGAILTEPNDGELAWDGKIEAANIDKIIYINTYNDHRMALSFAPLALIDHKVLINNPMVVTKSYPTFWEDLKNIGFKITKIT